MYFKLLSLWTKSYVVTILIHLKPLQQYFCIVPFVFQYFPKGNLEFFLGVNGLMDIFVGHFFFTDLSEWGRIQDSHSNLPAYLEF